MIGSRRWLLPSLRFGVPVFVLTVTALIAVCSTYWQVAAHKQEVEREARADLTHELTSLQDTLEYLYLHGASERAQQEIAALRAGQYTVVALLLDGEARVVAAGVRDRIGLPFESVLLQLPASVKEVDFKTLFARTRATMTGTVQVTQDGGSIVGIYPVILGMEPGLLSRERIGMLLEVRDLAVPKRHATWSALRLAAWNIAALGGFALLLTALFEIMITRRVRRLIEATRQLAAGDFAATSGVSGNDEIAQIGTAFDQMAQRVEESRQFAHARELRLQGILNAEPAGVFLFGEDSEIIEVNPAGLDLLGARTMVSAAPRTLAELVAGEHREMFRKFLRDIFESAQGKIECQLERPPGERIWVDCHARLLSEDGSRLRAAVAIMRDITHAKQEQERFRLMVEGAPNAMIMVDRAGRIELVNAKVEQLFGYSPWELIGHHVEMLLPGRSRDAHTELRRGYFGNAQARPMGSGRDLFGLRKDGTEVAVEIGLSPMETREGFFVLASIVEITDRKRAESALRASRDQLRAFSAYLQDSIEEERTRIAREIHDQLGQMITALKMDTVWLQRRMDRLADDQRIEPMRRKLEDMCDLFDTVVVAVSHLTGELRPPLLDKVGLPVAVRTYLHELASRCALKIEWAVDEGADLAPAGRLGVFRVLQEAMTNIVRHAQAQHVRVTLAGNASHVTLEVVDDGRGISPEARANERSFGLMGMTERARLMGAEVTIEPAKGSGTRVHLVVPRPEQPVSV